MHYSKCHGAKSALSFSITAYVLLSCMVARDVHVLHDSALQKHVSTCIYNFKVLHRRVYLGLSESDSTKYKQKTISNSHILFQVPYTITDATMSTGSVCTRDRHAVSHVTSPHSYHVKQLCLIEIIVELCSL